MYIHSIKIISLMVLGILVGIWGGAFFYSQWYTNTPYSTILQNHIDIPILFFGMVSLVSWFPWWDDEEILFWWYALSTFVATMCLFGYWYLSLFLV